MKNGSIIRPHMHERGWLSGSIYINVPHKKNRDYSNLIICIEDENLISGDINNQKKVIDVVNGSLVLFPVSLLHYTMPFDSEESRIVLEFNVTPQ